MSLPFDIEKFDLNIWIEQLKQCNTLSTNQIKLLCEKVNFKFIKQLKLQAKEILEKEPNVLEISTPITICSRINGQFLDLLEIFKIAGNSPNSNYLFLGSYINRGYYSIECISLLLCLKVRYPKRLYLTRGCFDGRQISCVYGFYDECMTKYGNSKVFNYILDTLDYLPLVAKIENKIFCVHGGLTPEINTVNDINSLDRIQEIPQDGPIAGLLWNEALDCTGWRVFAKGAAYYFGNDISEKFNHLHNFKLMITGNKLLNEGFMWLHNGQVCKIFSAPNYCYRCGNKGGIMIIDEYLENNIIQFSQTKIQKIKDENDDYKRRILDYFL